MSHTVKPLFSIDWGRIVLDEGKRISIRGRSKFLIDPAHQIHSSTSARAKAVCALRSEIRWAVTGTPIQNRWEDIVSLLMFLRVYKEQDIRSLKKHLKHNSAKTYVRRMLSLICLRRSKKAIQLPNRRDKIHKIVFNEEEAARYESINDKLVQSLEQTSGTVAASPANVLSKINLLRQICNLGLHYRGTELFHAGELRSQEPVGQELFDCMLSAGAAICSSCGENFSADSYLSGDPLKEVMTAPSHPHVSTCGRLLCARCLTLPQVATSISHHVCSLALGCRFSPVSTSDSIELTIETTLTSRLPSKIRVLTNDLLALPESDKRYCQLRFN